jgi:enterochelin esterase family protein
MFSVPTRAFLICLMAGLGPAIAQTPTEKQAPAKPAAAARPPAPTRDPNTPGYVQAKELPDGAIPSAKEDGNFIIGPTHNPAPEMAANEGVPNGDVFEFTLESKDSRIYPSIAREPNTFAVPDPTDPNKVIVNGYPARYTRRVAVYVPKRYVPGMEAPFIVGADGADRTLFTAFDNLIAEHR